MAASDTVPPSELRQALLRGLVIPAHPLALTEQRKLDERRQTALTRYYCDAGAGGIAVGVHTTQFAIRDPAVGLFAPVLDLARRTVREWCRERTPIMVAGVCGPTAQALGEAELAVSLGYDAGLLSLAALRNADNNSVLDHCRRVADIIPVIGFYLQPAVGGRVLDRDFWRGFFDIDRVVAIKVAPFDRYRTLDVVNALADSGRTDVALYTGNDDAIVADLLTPFPAAGTAGSLHFSGGLLGQWAVWTKSAVDLLRRCHAVRQKRPVPDDSGDPLRLLALGAELTDANAALFDPSHQFAGCIPGIHEILRRQGLLAGRWCLDPHEELSPGQMEEIDRVIVRYPHLTDDEFVKEGVHRWLG
ncbi:MAG: dihydrodipicolinate synthase family protein [Vicinamibacterales bacterium]